MSPSESSIDEFRPVLTSRRGEIIAWASTFLVGGTWAALSWTGGYVPFAVPFLLVVLSLSSLSISLGNWMDRRTLIRLDEEGINFRNGLRDVRFSWGEIQEVRVLPSRWGKKVQVLSENAYFGFRTLGEVRVQGEVKGSMGFAEGEHILERILAGANLKRTRSGAAGGASADHYVRE